MSRRSFLIPLGVMIALGSMTFASADDDKGTASAPTEEKAGTSRAKTAKPERSKSKASKSDNTGSDTKNGPKLEKATFGGGCFWCQEAVFERVPGVKSVVSGFAGGYIARPSYELVSTGMTGHAEVVQITFDPTVVSFDDLLNIFWASHDPTTLNSQGPDHGTQYRSIILYHNDDQKQAAKKSYEKLTEARAFPSPIVTELVPLKKFYPAERYHQDYYRRHSSEEYCQIEIAPKLEKLRMILKSTKFKPSAPAK